MPDESELRAMRAADGTLQVGYTVHSQRPDSTPMALARVIGLVLRRLYPQNPDVVLGREAMAIAEALVAEWWSPDDIYVMDDDGMSLWCKPCGWSWHGVNPSVAELNSIVASHQAENHRTVN